jgi:hypothetical protein
MPWAAAAAVGGALIGANASKSAAKTVSGATDRASEIQQAQFEQNRQDQMPWMKAGEGALGQLSAGIAPGGEFNRNFTMGDFAKDPGYDFRLSEGTGALEGSAAARGGLLSGATLKGLTRYGQDYASNEYSNAYNRFNTDLTNRWNRLSGVAGLGQTATNIVGSQGLNTAGAIGQNGVAGAQASAGGQVGAASSINSGIGSLSNWYQQRQLLNPSTNSSYNYGGYSGSNDRSPISSGNNMDWFMKYGSSGD